MDQFFVGLTCFLAVLAIYFCFVRGRHGQPLVVRNQE